MKKITNAVGMMVFVIVLMSLLCFVPVYFLWNWLMPELFGLKEITLLQSAGICFLCSFLFKGSSRTSTKE